MIGDGFNPSATAGLFWTVNVCWASCNKQGQRSSEHFFMVLFPMLFEVRRIVCLKIKQTLNNELKFHIVNIY